MGFIEQEENKYINKLYFNKIHKSVDIIDSARFIVYKIYDDEGKTGGRYLKTTVSGKVIYDFNYSNIEKNIKHGTSKAYWWNGKLKYSINYSHGRYNGELSIYYKSGQLKRKDYFIVGDFKKGNCYTEAGKDTTHFDFLVRPKYKEGVENLIKFVNSNLKRPKETTGYKNEGRVIVKFHISKKGKVNNSSIRHIRHNSIFICLLV